VSARAYRYGFVDVDVDVDAFAALAGWMHRVRADLAGCYETTILEGESASTCNKNLYRGGPLCPPASFESSLWLHVDIFIENAVGCLDTDVDLACTSDGLAMQMHSLTV